MAVPLYVLRNERNRVYKQRKGLEQLSHSEIRKIFGMEYRGARELINMYEPFLDGVRSTCIPIETKVLAFISYLRSGSFQWTLGNMTGTSQTSVSRIIDHATDVTVYRLAKTVIKFPESDDEKQENRRGFYNMSGFPNVIGVLDGTHVGRIAPQNDEPIFVNRKNYHSINCQVISGHNYKFLDINAKFPGSTHDAFVWSQCSAKRRLESGQLGEGVIIADSGYPTTQPRLMIPFSNPNSREQRQYNQKLKTTRSSVERTIGLWKSRFRSMCRTGGLSCYSPEKICRLIVASEALHNVCIQKEIPMLLKVEEHMNNYVLPDLREEY